MFFLCPWSWAWVTNELHMFRALPCSWNFPSMWSVCLWTNASSRGVLGVFACGLPWSDSLAPNRESNLEIYWDSDLRPPIASLESYVISPRLRNILTSRIPRCTEYLRPVSYRFLPNLSVPERLKSISHVSYCGTCCCRPNTETFIDTEYWSWNSHGRSFDRRGRSTSIEFFGSALRTNMNVYHRIQSAICCWADRKSDPVNSWIVLATYKWYS